MKIHHIAFAISTFSALVGQTPAFAQAPIPLRVGYDGFSITTAPMDFAQKQGLFKKYGLDIAITYVDGGPTLTQAVVGGSIDIGQNGYTSAAAAALQGADLVFIGGISNKLPFQLVVKNEIKTAADLKGKRIAISRFGSSTDTAVTFAVTYLGLKRSDVNILQLGGETTRTAAMMSGQLDASMEQYPRTAELMDEGYHVLADCTEIAGDYPNTSYVTTKTFLKKNPEAAKRFMMAISEGIAAYKQNPEAAIKSTSDFLKLKPGHAAKDTYDYFTKEIFPDVPAPSIKGIAIVLDELKATVPAAATTKPESLVDMSILDGLQKDGFFASLKK